MYRPELYIAAYERIKSKPGNMTPGADGSTLDGFSKGHIERIIEKMKDQSFQFTPLKRTEIPKPKGGKRVISVPKPTDKVVQEIIRTILEAIYDSPRNPYFSNASHGFRPNRNPHTALKCIKDTWTGVRWFVEGDISKCFDEIDFRILESILRKKIEDERFVELILKSLKAGYFTFGKYQNSWIGAAQGSISSPILANIYMHEFDKYMEKIITQLSKGKRRREHKKYKQLSYEISQLTKKGYPPDDPEIIRKLKIRIETPGLDPYDPNYRRIKYVRYCDDFLIGIIGSHSLAQEIKQQVASFLQGKLRLRLNEEKTKITQASTEGTKFLGLHISTGKGKGLQKRTQNNTKGRKTRVGAQAIRLKVPKEDIIKRLNTKGICDARGKPIHVSRVQNNSVYQITQWYNTIWRGIRNYFGCTDYMTKLNHINYILEQSLVKTLALKLKLSSGNKVYQKFGKQLEMQEEGKKVQFDKTRLNVNNRKFNTTDPEVDKLEAWINSRSKSSLDFPCRICHKTENVVMHHVKHIRKIGKKIKGFTKAMASINRKQIPVCPECHLKIHKGEYDGIDLKSLSQS